jgi:hypothetical protein
MGAAVYNSPLGFVQNSNLATTSAHQDWAVSSVVEHCLHTRSFQVARLFPHHIFALTFSGRNFHRPALVCTQETLNFLSNYDYATTAEIRRTRIRHSNQIQNSRDRASLYRGLSREALDLSLGCKSILVD